MEKLDPEDASSEALEMESLAWLNRLLSGAVTHEQAEAFRAWRVSSPDRGEAFARTVRFRRAAQRAIQAERQAQVSLLYRAPRPTRAPNMARRALLGGALAASGAGLAILLPADRLWSSWAELTSDYHTAVGQRRELRPAPGVGVELNTRTSMSRQAANGRPGLDLVSGEAAVTARRPLDAPFTIQAGPGRTMLAQGEVNIRSVGGSVCVTCLHGQAHILHPQGGLLLTSGQQTIYTAHQLEAATGVDPQVVDAWRRGLLIFRDAPLQQVVDQLNRYRSGRIILTDASLGRRPVYAVFRLQQIAQAVGQVQALTGAKAIDLPGGIVLLS